MSYVDRISQLMVLYDMYKYGNCIFKNDRDSWRISHLSKHLSFVKRYHLLASAVNMIICGLSAFYKIGTM